MGDKLRSHLWGFNLFIASKNPSFERFKAYNLAKVHLVGSLYHALTISFICTRQQNTSDSEFLLEKYQNKSLGKGYPRFIWQIH